MNCRGFAPFNTHADTRVHAHTHTLLSLLTRRRVFPQASRAIPMKVAPGSRDLAETKAGVASVKSRVPDFKTFPLITFPSKFSI